MQRWDTPDWDYVGWHYKGIYAAGRSWHNALWIRAKGHEHVPRDGGVILACNHTSWWDPIALMSTVRRPVCWLAKKEIMNNRFNKWFFFDRGGAIPVDRNTRNPEAYAAATRALLDRRIVGVFPEGGRYVGELGPAKTGVARLAFESGAPVLPVAILTDRFWPKGKTLPHLGHRIYIHFGEPFHLKGDPKDAAAARVATDEVMARIRTLLDGALEVRGRGKWAIP